jgi:5-methylcytosine-specific restriction endonuclease McrA
MNLVPCTVCGCKIHIDKEKFFVYYEGSPCDICNPLELVKILAELEAKNSSLLRTPKKKEKTRTRKSIRDKKLSDMLKKEQLLKKRIGCVSCGFMPKNPKKNWSSMHAHHVVPLSQGGKDKKENMIILCKECHNDAHRSRSKCEKVKNERDKSLYPSGFQFTFLNGSLEKEENGAIS